MRKEHTYTSERTHILGEKTASLVEKLLNTQTNGLLLGNAANKLTRRLGVRVAYNNAPQLDTRYERTQQKESTIAERIFTAEEHIHSLYQTGLTRVQDKESLHTFMRDLQTERIHMGVALAQAQQHAESVLHEEYKVRPPFTLPHITSADLSSAFPDAIFVPQYTRRSISKADTDISSEAFATREISLFLTTHKKNEPVNVQELKTMLQLATYAPRDRFPHLLTELATLYRALPSDPTSEQLQSVHSADDLRQILIDAGIVFIPARNTQTVPDITALTSESTSDPILKGLFSKKSFVRSLNLLNIYLDNPYIALDGIEHANESMLTQQFTEYLHEGRPAYLQGEPITEFHRLDTSRQAHTVRRMWRSDFHTSTKEYFRDVYESKKNLIRGANYMLWIGSFELVNTLIGMTDNPQLIADVNTISSTFTVLREQIEATAEEKHPDPLSEGKRFKYDGLPMEYKIRLIQLATDTSIALYQTLGKYADMPTKLVQTF